MLGEGESTPRCPVCGSAKVRATTPGVLECLGPVLVATGAHPSGAQGPTQVARTCGWIWPAPGNLGAAERAGWAATRARERNDEKLTAERQAALDRDRWSSEVPPALASFLARHPNSPAMEFTTTYLPAGFEGDTLTWSQRREQRRPRVGRFVRWEHVSTYSRFSVCSLRGWVLPGGWSTEPSGGSYIAGDWVMSPGSS